MEILPKSFVAAIVDNLLKDVLSSEDTLEGRERVLGLGLRPVIVDVKPQVRVNHLVRDWWHPRSPHIPDQLVLPAKFMQGYHLNDSIKVAALGHLDD